ncbi:unnamed protein product [Lactuca virosa]|uniref:Uncharacterized protein n=1 Tax=Lactuca virosa TaxID=75947 RepID=A0AAU9NXP2_9ASTR|nr:unnamed protein product [Lactuca virosa]
MLQKVDSEIKEKTSKLEQLLTEERIARLKSEENARIAQKKSDEEIQKVESTFKETTLKLEQLYEKNVDRTAPRMLINGYMNALSIAVATNYSSGGGAPVEEMKEVPKVESDDDMGFGLFD